MDVFQDRRAYVWNNDRFTATLRNDRDLHAVLTGLDAWLEANAPADRAALNPPATPTGIDAIADRRFHLRPDLPQGIHPARR